MRKLGVEEIERDLDRLQQVLAPMRLDIQAGVRMAEQHGIRPLRGQACDGRPFWIEREQRIASRSGRTVDAHASSARDIEHPAARALVRVYHGTAVTQAPAPRGRQRTIDPPRPGARHGDETGMVDIEPARYLQHDRRRSHGRTQAHQQLGPADRRSTTRLSRQVREPAIVHVDRAASQLARRWVQRVRERRRWTQKSRGAEACGQQVVALAVERDADRRADEYRARPRGGIGCSGRGSGRAPGHQAGHKKDGAGCEPISVH